MALPNLKLLVLEVSRNFLDKLPPKVYRDFDNWTQNGSTSTIQDFRKLPQEERHQVVEYMKSFRPYGKEIVNGRNTGWGMPDWIIFQKQNIWKNIR